jgi:hypothetical protein
MSVIKEERGGKKKSFGSQGHYALLKCAYKAIAHFQREEEFESLLAPVDHVPEANGLIRKFFLNFCIRKFVKKIEPIDYVKSSTKSRKGYLHAELIQKVPKIENFIPMSINEIRGIPIDDRQKNRKKKKKDRKKKHRLQILAITWLEINKAQWRSRDFSLTKISCKEICFIFYLLYRFHLFSFSPTFFSVNEIIFFLLFLYFFSRWKYIKLFYSVVG